MGEAFEPADRPARQRSELAGSFATQLLCATIP